MRLIDADKLRACLENYAMGESPSNVESADDRKISKIVYKALMDCVEIADRQPTVKMKDSQDDIANIIYGTLDHMYCDNCRFSSEIKESDSDEWNCDECHRKYNGWGVSMQESNRIAKEILKQLGE